MKGVRGITFTCSMVFLDFALFWPIAELFAKMQAINNKLNRKIFFLGNLISKIKYRLDGYQIQNKGRLFFQDAEIIY